MSGAILVRILFPISPCWFWKSSCASWVKRSKLFCFASICFTSLSRDSSFSLSCWALSCFLRLSISSAEPFSSFCLGSNFLLSVSKSRRPSLDAKIACSMLMVPTLVPVALGSAAAPAAAEGALGVAATAAVPAAGSAWARAKRERPNTTATVTRVNLPITNLLVASLLIIGSFELLRIFRKCWMLHLKHEPETGAASAQGSYDARLCSRRTASVVLRVWTLCIIRSAPEQPQTDLAVLIVRCAQAGGSQASALSCQQKQAFCRFQSLPGTSARKRRVNSGTDIAARQKSPADYSSGSPRRSGCCRDPPGGWPHSGHSAKQRIARRSPYQPRDRKLCAAASGPLGMAAPERHC